MNTTRGCACKQTWSYKGEGCSSHCCAIADAQPWCFVQDKACEGEDIDWGYCDEEDFPVCDWSLDGNGVIRPVCSQFFADGSGVFGGSAGNDSGVLGGSSACTFNWDKKYHPCRPPPLRTCKEPDFGSSYVVEAEVSKSSEAEEDPVADSRAEEEGEHGAHRRVSCADDAAPIAKEHAMQTWGEEWYKGPKAAQAWCNNGTWVEPGFVCASRRQIGLLKDVEHYLRWTEERLRLAEGMGVKWIDDRARTRYETLKRAHVESRKMLLRAAALEMPEADDLQAAIGAMTENAIVARGERFTEEACKNLESVFASATVPGRPGEEAPGFRCAYTAQETPTGYNVMSNPPSRTVFFREGCACESRWSAGCPFQLHLKRSFRQLGFAGADAKIASTAPGAVANAMCWYWSDPARPERGYLRQA